ANKRNSIFLMVLMALALFLLGYLIGFVFFGPHGAFLGLIIASAIWIIMTLISFSGGDQIFLLASRAKPVTHDVHPQLFNVVEEMAISASLPVPKVYIIDDPAPNAFATGRKPETASIAVTAGLLGRLNRDELQGVVAHEMSHILHRDVLFVTLAGIMLGSIVLLSQVFLRGMFYSSMSGRRRCSSGSGGGGAAMAIMLLIAIIAAILAPIFAHLLYFALSRKREYLADAGAARLTRYPEGLACALEKIANDTSPQLAAANKVTAPMYIANPLKKKKKGAKLSNLSSTHPPISERIKILRNMTHGAAFKDYEKAFTDVTKARTVVPTSALKQKEDVDLRRPGAPAKQKPTQKQQLRQIGDLMRTVNGFIFLTCLCGLKLKIPPNFKAEKVKCPKCSRILELARKK
ncbi:MAG: M48 family metallopeptidase, partial [Planctomycetota bacterium]